MDSITFALSTDDRLVPGVDAALCGRLFVMHDVPVREWISGVLAEVGGHGIVVVAGDEWVNGGGFESLTVPVDRADADILGGIRKKHAKTVTEASDE